MSDPVTPDDLFHDESLCAAHISGVLSRFSDKWSLLVVRVLGRGPRRFNALKREVGQISHKVLASTLRELEENGFVSRTVTPVTPPQVEYALTEFGREFAEPVQVFADWVMANAGRIDAARAEFSRRQAA